MPNEYINVKISFLIITSYEYLIMFYSFDRLSEHFALLHIDIVWQHSDRVALWFDHGTRCNETVHLSQDC